MESSTASSRLEYYSPAWPARFSGVSIFVATLIIHFFFPNVPLFVPIISFSFMILAVFLAAETTVTADKTPRTLTVIKKRIFGSTGSLYSFDDIVYLNQKITTTSGQNGETSEKSAYSLALKSQPGSALYERGRIPNPITIPTSPLTMFSSTARNIQEFTRAKELANFIGVQLYINGGQNDAIVNTMENIPGYLSVIKNIPDIVAQAKIENDKAAKEIMQERVSNKK